MMSDVFQLKFDELLSKKTLTKLHFSSLYKMVIPKQEARLLLLITWQEMVSPLVNKKSYYNNFKMNFKLQNICHSFWFLHKLVTLSKILYLRSIYWTCPNV